MQLLPRYSKYFPLEILLLPIRTQKFSQMTKSILVLFSGAFFFNSVYCQITTLQNKNLVIEIKNNLQTSVNNTFSGSSKMMNNFSFSEFLVTKYFSVKKFPIIKKEKKAIHNETGNGIEWKFYGKNNTYHLEKILSIKLYDHFPNTAYFTVQYINLSNHDIVVKKWVSHQYNIIPSTDTTKFWSFQGSSHNDRRDWIQKVNPGFYEKNYMGMNASDYGGGIPVIDLWRKDAGIAVGHAETVAKLVSLPIDYDKYATTANISIEYEYPREEIVAPGDTLTTFETFISVHQKDCFVTLSNFSNYMQTKGIKPAPSEPAAFEPIWCAWGYERNFTIKEILQTLPKVKELGIKWVGLDDGYQQAEGDWHTNKDHFPNGDTDMKAFVDSIHAQGMKAVLWWAPLAVDPGSKILKADPKITLLRKDGSPQYITWWDSYLMAPTYKGTIATTIETVKLFLQDWNFDALKLDGQHLNACAPDYSDAHDLSYPEQAYEQLPMLYKTLFETARSIKPKAVVQFCPCGDCMSFYNMPYTNQFVASDPLSSWQVRLKGKVYKALMPGTAYFGDHVELTDNKQDFASQIGIGAVPGSKFVWPATGVASKDVNLLTPEKEFFFKKWFALYNEKMLSKGTYWGNLYDIGYDYPETHCIQKDDAIYYAFYNSSFKGTIKLRGLNAGKKYKVVDYFHAKQLGTVNGSSAKLDVQFKNFLLIEVKAVD